MVRLRVVDEYHGHGPVPRDDAERQALVSRWPASPDGDIHIDFGDGVTLTVVCGPALEGVARAENPFNAWYLDGFAPSRNPDMWSEELMRLVLERTASGGSFATYAAAGFVRRNLQAAGFVVEKRKGFAGKREMLRGDRN